MAEICQRVRKSSSACPRHGKDHVQRDASSLSAVQVCKARRVGYDNVGDERGFRDRICLYAGSPESLEQLLDHGALLLYVLVHHALEAWEETRVLHHKLHQTGRIAADRKELEPSLDDKLGKDVVRCQTYPVATALQLLPYGDKRLHIAAATNNLNNNIELQIRVRDGVGWCWAWIGLGLASCCLAGPSLRPLNLAADS